MQRLRIITWYCALAALLQLACADPAPLTGDVSTEPTGQPGTAAQCERDLADLHAINAATRACSTADDCPSGAFCDREAGHCAWSCLADSDCATGEHCTCDGQCVAGTLRRAAGDDCLRDDAALEGLAAGGADEPCYTDSGCPLCGSYCSPSEFRCTVDCIPGSAEHTCPADQTCGPLGRCESATPEVTKPSMSVDPPSLVLESFENHPVIDLEMAFPEGIPSDTGVQPTVHVVAPSGLLVACDGSETTPITEFATDCWLYPPWIAGADPSRAARSVAVAATSADADVRIIEFRSDDTVSPLTTVSVAPAGPGIPRSGAYRGVLTLLDGDDELVSASVEAYADEDDIVLVDRTQVLSVTPAMVLPRPGNSATIGWVSGQQSVEGAVPATIFTDAVTFDRTLGTLEVFLELSGDDTASPALSARLQLGKAVDDAFSACSNGCGQGSVCWHAVGACIDAALPTPVGPDASITDLELDGWGAVAAPRIAAGTGHPAMDAVEWLLCSGTAAGWDPESHGFGPDTSTISGDVECATGVDWLPALERQSFAEVDQDVVDDLVATCIAELQSLPPSLGGLEETFDLSHECVNHARMKGALSWLLSYDGPGAYPADPRAARYLQYLLRSWARLHAALGRQGLQAGDLAETILAEAEENPDLAGQFATSPNVSSLHQVLEKAWSLLLDSRVGGALQEAPADSIAQPDYRRSRRPIARWTMRGGWFQNGIAFDAEYRGHDLTFTGKYHHIQGHGSDRLRLSGGVGTTASSPDLQLDRNLTVGVWIDPDDVVHTQPVLSHSENSFVLEVRDFWQSQQFRVVVAHATAFGTETIEFEVPDWYRSQNPHGAQVAVVRDARLKRYDLYFAQDFVASKEYTHQPLANGGGFIRVGGDPLGGPTYHGRIGQIVIWETAVAGDMIKAIRHGNGDYLQHPGTFPPDRGYDEPLPIAINELATVHLEIARERLARETDSAASCLSGTLDEALLADMGATVRSVLAGVQLADKLAAKVGCDSSQCEMPWGERYLLTRAEATAQLSRLGAELLRFERCRASLEPVVPLYFRTDSDDETAKFYASSSYLSAKAMAANEQAAQMLELARSAWLQQRESEYQVALSDAQLQSRIDVLAAGVEEPLYSLCGVEPDTVGELIADDTFEAATCFFDREAPGCSQAHVRPLDELPERCVRGGLGAAMLSVRTAVREMQRQRTAFDDSHKLYNLKVEHCNERASAQYDMMDAIDAHRAEVKKLARAKHLLDTMVGTFTGFASAPPSGPGVTVAVVGTIAGTVSAELGQAIAYAEAEHEVFMQKAEIALSIRACYQEAELLIFDTFAAARAVERAADDLVESQFALQNMFRDAELSLATGRTMLNREVGRHIVPPEHHYWLAEKATRYGHLFRRARHLAILAARAYEYESQLSLPSADAIAQVVHPWQLAPLIEEMIDDIEPGKRDGWQVEDSTLVFSLRDEIMQLEERPGESRGRRFGSLLTSPRNAVFSPEGEYMGQAIRFEMRPGSLTALWCAERLWRVSVSLQMDFPPNTVSRQPVVLYQSNHFGQKDCSAPFEQPEVLDATARPEIDLLETEFVDVSSAPVAAQTPVTIQAYIQKPRDELSDTPHPDSSRGLAGRGVYGEYVLFFSKDAMSSQLELGDITDVLIRFDLSEATYAPDL